MNISGPFIRRPIGTALLAIGLFVVGVICYLQLGVSALPNIQIPVIFVHANQAGADATTMASTVTAPLERHLGQLPGIDRMRSSSSEGSSLVFMIFQSDRDIDSAALDVQTAINSAQSDLPAGLGTPMFQKANPNDDPVIAIALTSETQSPTTSTTWPIRCWPSACARSPAFPRWISPAPPRRRCGWTSTCA